MHRNLEAYLESIDRTDDYRVDEVLKASDVEITQRVFFQGKSGSEQGPYIRKIIQRSDSLGQAYERIWIEQQQGKRFSAIPRLTECYATESSLTVVMEHIPGKTIADLLYEEDPSVDMTKRVFPLVCDAIEEIHTSFDPPLIHRDLKPSNIMLTENSAVLIDFGIARSFKDGADEDTLHYGTRGYAPPEQFGFGQTSVRSDIYALGMILYYLLVEETPSNAVREAGFSDERIPEPLREVIRKATALDPRQRYGSASELKAAFLNAISTVETPVPASMENPRTVTDAPASQKAIPVINDPSPRPSPQTFSQPARGSSTSVGAIVWNVLLLLIWNLFLVCTAQIIIQPKGSVAELSVAGRIISGYGIFGLGAGFLVYLLSNKQWIKERIPFLGRIPKVLEIVICVSMAIFVSILSTVIAVLIS